MNWALEKITEVYMNNETAGGGPAVQLPGGSGQPAERAPEGTDRRRDRVLPQLAEHITTPTAHLSLTEQLPFSNTRIRTHPALALLSTRYFRAHILQSKTYCIISLSHFISIISLIARIPSHFILIATYFIIASLSKIQSVFSGHSSCLFVILFLSNHSFRSNAIRIDV